MLLVQVLVENKVIFDVVSFASEAQCEMLDEKLVLVNDDRKPLKKIDDPVSMDSDSEVEEVFNETAGLMVSTSFKVDKSFESCNSVGNKSMYEQWRETYIEDPYEMMTLMTVV
ncbi:hypothetical protein Tco_0100725 [Tanacetum coccineum]